MLRFGIWVRKEHLCREEPFPWIFIGWQPFSLRVQPEWTTGTQSQRTSITPSLSPLQLTPQTHPATGRRALALTRSNEWRTDRHSHGRERSVDGRERSAVIFRNSVPVSVSRRGSLQVINKITQSHSGGHSCSSQLG